MNIEMISIDGLDQAIIGTGMRAKEREVLVYDATKCEELLLENGVADNLFNFLDSIDIQSLGDRAPLFIYLDSNFEDDKVDDNKGKRPDLRIVH